MNFIVAEITKNWTGHGDAASGLLSQRFEAVINTNDQRGYKLVDWKITSAITPDGTPDGGILTETIIAIFEKKKEG